MTEPIRIFVPALFVLAWSLAAVGCRLPGISGWKAREPNSLDGLRGLASFAVVVHHASIWEAKLATGAWEVPTSNLLRQLGETSVALFFMVTGFLFWRKAIDSRLRPIHWGRFYLARFLRITPLYLLACFLVFLVVGFQSGFVLQETPGALVWNGFQWLFYSIPDIPDLNNVLDSRLALARATWSIPFEWWFYLALPAGAALFRRPSWVVLILSGTLALALYRWHGKMAWIQLLPFLAGMAAAHLDRASWLRRTARRPAVGLLSVVVLGASVARFPTIHGLAPLFLTSAVFTAIALGNDLFGLLTSKPLVWLGEISFGTYLLHGLFLYLPFGVLGGQQRTSLEHWALVACLVPALLATAAILHTIVERPALAMVDPLARRFAHLFRRS